FFLAVITPKMIRGLIMIDNGSSPSRREFLTGVAGAGAMAEISSLWSNAKGGSEPGRRLPIVYFSKHLHWLDWEHMAETTKELGFDGLDVTVREGGHVEPAQVREDLP